MPIERVPIKLPDGFEAAKHQHLLLAQITREHGEGFVIESIDHGNGRAVAVRHMDDTNVKDGTDENTKIVRLDRAVKMSAGDEMAAKFEAANPGFTMTTFDPYLHKAVLKRLTEQEYRCREALAAALKIKPWDIQVESNKDGGFTVCMHPGYTPVRDDKVIDEAVTTIIGSPGWYVTKNVKQRQITIVPGELFSFPRTIPSPLGPPEPFDHSKPDTLKVELGHYFPEAEENGDQVFSLNLVSGPHTQIGGLAGAGKSVTGNRLIYEFVSKGAQVAVIDVPHKAADYLWLKPFVMDHGWGCDSLLDAAAVLEHVYQIGLERAEILKQRKGVTQWLELPPGEGFKPILVLCDEVSELLAMDKQIRVNEDSPKRLRMMAAEAEQNNYFRELISNRLTKIATGLRFVGVFVSVLTQVASVNTGLSTNLRTNLHNKILMGLRPNENNKKLIYTNPTVIPVVPEHIIADPVVSKGVGVVEPAVGTPRVFKSYYASVNDYVGAFHRYEVPQTNSPLPTDKMLNAIWSFEGEEQEDIVERRKQLEQPDTVIVGADGKPLTGAALAAAYSKQNSR